MKVDKFFIGCVIDILVYQYVIDARWSVARCTLTVGAPSTSAGDTEVIITEPARNRTV